MSKRNKKRLTRRQQEIRRKRLKKRRRRRRLVIILELIILCILGMYLYVVVDYRDGIEIIVCQCLIILVSRIVLKQPDSRGIVID